MAALRVAVLVPDLRGSEGAETTRLALNLARAAVLADESIEVVMGIVNHVRPGAEPAQGLRAVELAGESGGHEPGDAVGWDLLGVIEGADIVHVHGPFTRFGASSMIAARAMRRPLCVSMDGPVVSPLGRDAGLLALANAVILPSESARGRLVGERKVSVIRGVVDTDEFQPDSSARRDVVVSTGPVEDRHGFDRLLGVIPKGVRLVVLGSGFSPARAPDHVTLVADGDTQERRGWFSRATAVIASLPAAAADAPTERVDAITLLEAMSCGAPVVCGRDGPWAEHLDDGVTGFIAEDDGQVASRLRDLVASAALQAEVGVRARAACLESWSLASVAAPVAGVYNALR